MVKIGIIGGTGLDDPAFLNDRAELPGPYETPYGQSSNLIVSGRLNGVEVVLLARHGKNHHAPPSCVNYRANIYTLTKILNCDVIVATNAVGSLRGDLHQVGDLAVVDQFIDFTAHGGGQRGPHTFFDAQPGHFEGLVHTPMSEPFSRQIRVALVGAARNEGVIAHDGATCVVIEGPRFSSGAESNMFRMWGGHIIGMTLVPEVCLANELGVPYASVALITDVDGDETSHDLVLQSMKQFSLRLAATIARAATEIAAYDWEKVKKAPTVH